MILTKRQEELISILKKSNNWIKGSYLAKMLNVSVRTIRNDIYIINNSKPNSLILASKTLGYKITDEFNKISNIDSLNGMSNDQRLIYILTKLCISYPNKINIYDLSSELFVSESTIVSDFTSLKSLFNNLNNTNFSVLKESDFIYLNGDVSELGKNYSFIIKNKMGALDNNLNCLFFENFDLSKLMNILPDFLKDLNFFSKYISFVDLVLYCSILLERSYNNININLHIDYNKENKEYFFVIKLIDFLEKNFNISITNFNTEFMIALLDSAFTLESKENDIKCLNNYSDNLELILKEIFEEIFELYLIDFYQFDDIMHDLLIHMRLALTRINNKYNINNPLKEELKNQYPFLFDIAFTIGEKLSEKLNIHFKRDELCYIVVYLALALKRIDIANNTRNHLKVLVIILEGKSILTHILNILNESYKNKNVTFIGISSIEELFKYQLKKHNNLVISTTNLKQFGIHEHLLINQSFSMIDRFNIKNLIYPALIKIKELNFELIFSHFFNSSCFKCNFEATSKEQLLEQICSDLYSKEYVHKDFLSSIMERENLLSTGINTGIALPHTTTGKAIKSCIYVITSNKNINWSGTKVKLIFLFAINSSDFKKLSTIYDFVINISSPSSISLLNKSNSFDDFKKIMHDEYMKM